MHVCPDCGDSSVGPGTCDRDGSEFLSTEDDSLLGTTIGSYRIARQIGAGGMGLVYLAVQPRIDSCVAIKVLSRDFDTRPDLVDRFFAEARATNVIQHENIVNVLDVDRLPSGRPYIIMEYLRGQPLSQAIEAEDRPLGGAIDVVLDVLSGLSAAHARQIIHRDLKPDNIFVSPEGRAKILDFGVAKLIPELMGRPGPTTTGALLGTPHYMSPEQAVGDPVDARSDIYSIGVILFECATGIRPFDASSLYRLLDMHIQSDPPRPRSIRPNLPESLEAIILKSLEKAPDDRFQTAEEMHSALKAVLEELPEEELRPIEFKEGSERKIPTWQRGRDIGVDVALASGSGVQLDGPTVAETPSSVARERVARKRRRMLLPIVAVVLALGGVAGAALYIRGAATGATTVVASAFVIDAGVPSLTDASYVIAVATPPDASSPDASLPDAAAAPAVAPKRPKKLGTDPMSLYGKAERKSQQRRFQSQFAGLYAKGVDENGRVRFDLDGRVTFAFLDVPDPMRAPASYTCGFEAQFDSPRKLITNAINKMQCSRRRVLARPRCSTKLVIERAMKKHNSVKPPFSLYFKGRIGEQTTRPYWSVESGQRTQRIQDDC